MEWRTLNWSGVNWCELDSDSVESFGSFRTFSFFQRFQCFQLSNCERIRFPSVQASHWPPSVGPPARSSTTDRCGPPVPQTQAVWTQKSQLFMLSRVSRVSRVSRPINSTSLLHLYASKLSLGPGSDSSVQLNSRRETFGLWTSAALQLLGRF